MGAGLVKGNQKVYPLAFSETEKIYHTLQNMDNWQAKKLHQDKVV